MSLWDRLRRLRRGDRHEANPPRRPPVDRKKPPVDDAESSNPEDPENEQQLGGYERKSPPASARQIEDQRDQLDAEYPEQIAKHYSDDGVSGKVHWTQRPGLSALLYAIADGELSGICFVALDRLTRPQDVLEQEDILAYCWEHGARVLSIREGELLPDAPASHRRKVIRLGIANQNQMWRMENAERRQRGRRRRLAQGHFNGGIPFRGRKYGYNLEEWWDPSQRRWRLDWVQVPEEMAVVAEIHDRCSDPKQRNYSLVARELNERGVPTVTGAPWGRSAVRWIALRTDQKPRENAEVSTFKLPQAPLTHPSVGDRNVVGPDRKAV